MRASATGLSELARMAGSYSAPLRLQSLPGGTVAVVAALSFDFCGGSLGFLALDFRKHETEPIGHRHRLREDRFFRRLAHGQ